MFEFTIISQTESAFQKVHTHAESLSAKIDQSCFHCVIIINSKQPNLRLILNGMHNKKNMKCLKTVFANELKNSNITILFQNTVSKFNHM